MNNLFVLVMTNGVRTIDITATETVVTACEGAIKIPISNINKMNRTISNLYNIFDLLGYEPVNQIVRQYA